MKRCFYMIILLLAGITAGQAAAAVQELSLGTLTQRMQKISVHNWSSGLHTQLVAACTSSGEWPALNLALEDWLITTYSPKALSSAAWHAMAGLQQWNGLLARQGESLQRITPGTLRWLLSDRSLTRDFFDILTPDDAVPAALDLLQTLYQTHPERFPRYNRLAIAMAIVWDVPRSFQPHQQVSPGAVLKPDCTPAQRFDFWVETNQKGLADYDLATLEPAKSKFIVDAVSPLDELRWAQSSVHFTRGRLGGVYSSIEYDTDRFENGVYVWPYEPYSLKEIERKGGICIDQAWFATVAGKASGIPTLYFSGRGRQGFHAWFGYMKNDDTWDMDCGRYAVDNYAVGTAVDPQTGKPLSDHQLTFISESYHSKPAYATASAHLRMLKIFARRGQLTKAVACADAALALAPKHLTAWEYKTTLLKQKSNSYEELNTHLTAMAKQFRDYPDITAGALRILVSAAREASDEATARATEKKIIDDTKRGRHDLSVAVYRTRMRDQAQQSEWGAACETVRDAISQFKDEVADVYLLTAEFIQICLQNSQPGEADRALRHFKSRTDYDDSPQMKAAVDEYEDRIRSARKKTQTK